MKCDVNWALNSLKELMEVGRQPVEPYPCGAPQCGREGPTNDLIQYPLKVHQGLERL